MNETGREWIGVVVAALIGAVVGAALVWVLASQQMSTLEAQLLAVQTEAIEAENRVDELEAALASATVTPPPVASAEPTPAAAPEKPAPIRQFAYLKSVSASKRTLVADYAQFLTGKAAADAAKKAGGESPPPNDYYIVNENPRLRTHRVSLATIVRLTTDDDGGAVSEGFDATFSQLASQLTANPEAASYRGFWLTIESDTVTRIEEQFTP